MVVSASLISCGTGKGKKAKVEDEGWVTLFDGTSTEGWRGYNKPAFPEQGWEIVEGTLHCQIGRAHV